MDVAGAGHSHDADPDQSTPGKELDRPRRVAAEGDDGHDQREQADEDLGNQGVDHHFAPINRTTLPAGGVLRLKLAAPKSVQDPS